MGDVFKALSSGFSRFVLGWILPSAITLSVFLVMVYPSMRAVFPRLPAGFSSNANGWIQIASFGLAVASISVLFAYSSLALYRLLEGYSLPRWMARRLRKRQLRDWQELKCLTKRRPAAQNWPELFERLENYPEDRTLILPTRLGNALRAMELYGSTRFGLDSQTLWYELQATCNSRLRRDIEDNRASVDFFISAIAHLSALALVSTATGGLALISRPASAATWPFITAALAAVLIPGSYRLAVKNVGDWHYSVRALVNLGRDDLAAGLGLSMPSTYEQESLVWQNVTSFVSYGRHDQYLSFLNGYRRSRKPEL